MVLPIWKTVLQFLKMLNVELLYGVNHDPTITALDEISFKRNEIWHTDTCKRMFIAVLFTTAKE